MIFVDTGFYRALFNKTDPHHEESLKIKAYLANVNEPTVINTTVLIETLNGIEGSPEDVEKAYYLLHDENRVVLLTDEDYLKSIKVNNWFGNSINYNDCTIINTMFNLGMHRIVSFDSDFEKVRNLTVISKI